MKKIIVSTIALSAALAAANVNAGTMSTTQAGGFYGQADIGYAQLDTKLDSNKNIFSARKVDKGDFAFALRGGYEAPLASDLLWGLEVGYLNLGKTEYKNTSFYGIPTNTNIDVKQQAADLLATITKKFDGGLNLFAKAGAAYVSQKGNAKEDGSTVAFGKNNKILPEIAGGLGYQLSDNVAITGTINHMFGKTLKSNSTNKDVASSTAALIGLKVNLG